MTELCRNRIAPLLTNHFSALANRHPHPGLLLTRGLEQYPADGDKAGHIADIARLPVPECYVAAFERWEKITADPARFACLTVRLAGRLYIGVTRDNALETGVTVAHAYGMPTIPGTAVKGLCRACAGTWLDDDGARRWLFGNEWGEGGEDGESGGLIFHDAWWVPNGRPFAPETVTVHHRDYYGSEGDTAATDFDSPVPAPQIAVRGSFRFAIEGPPLWTKLAARLLAEGLARRGIGAKRSSGYGLFARQEGRR